MARDGKARQKMKAPGLRPEALYLELYDSV